jgi:DNA-binding SARP family transcriptional activator
MVLRLSAHRGCVLCYLALFPDRHHPRHRLAGLVWPDVQEELALHSLRQAIADLRTVMGATAACLRVDRTGVTLLSSAVETDVAELDGLLAEGDVASVAAAMELARDPLLGDVDAAWADNARERTSQDLRSAVLRAATDALERHRPQEALLLVRRFLQRDPADEEIHRLAMRALALGRDRHGLHHQYSRCAEAVKAELDEGPDVETVQLYEGLMLALSSAP